MALFIAALAADTNVLEEEDDGNKSPLPYLHRHRLNFCKMAPGCIEVKFRKNRIRAFLLQEIASDTDYVSIKNGTRPTNCRCMGNIINLSEPEAASAIDYLYGFAIVTKAGQQNLLKDWIKYSDCLSVAYKRGDARKRTNFLLPGTTHLICKGALCRLLGIGMDPWKTVTKMAKNNLPPSHGLSGKVGNKVDDSIEETLRNFFTEILTFAQPRASLVIRSLVCEEVVTELWEDDKDIVQLPSHMTKRSLYDRLLLQIGWKYIYDSKSGIIERQAVEGTDQQQAPAWSSFRRYWAKHHPKLFIAGAREDVCNQCYVFANRHRYTAKNKQADEEEGKEEEENNKQEMQGPPAADDDNEEGDVTTMLRGEELVKTAARHVEMAQQQRALYQQKRKAAIDTAGLPLEERTLCFVADYAQNMYIPNFAAEQPGATYYYSPLSCYVFGVVDAAIDQLLAYMYTEDTAKKGGNNMASLLMHHLDQHGIIQQATQPFKELNFVMDNCGGQNKNRHILWLLHFIVKRKMATTATAIFLVRGHTKNACDRLFNTMKKQYRKCNSFTPEDLLESIKGNAKVDPFMVPRAAGCLQRLGQVGGWIDKEDTRWQHDDQPHLHCRYQQEQWQFYVSTGERRQPC
jgi:hypothetical protein